MGKAINIIFLNETIPHIDVGSNSVSFLLCSGLFYDQEWIWVCVIIFFIVERAWKERFFKVFNVGKDKFFNRQGAIS